MGKYVTNSNFKLIKTWGNGNISHKMPDNYDL